MLEGGGTGTDGPILALLLLVRCDGTRDADNSQSVAVFWHHLAEFVVSLCIMLGCHLWLTEPIILRKTVKLFFPLLM